jgi:hypothetical protein
MAPVHSIIQALPGESVRQVEAPSPRALGIAQAAKAWTAAHLPAMIWRLDADLSRVRREYDFSLVSRDTSLRLSKTFQFPNKEFTMSGNLHSRNLVGALVAVILLSGIRAAPAEDPNITKAMNAIFGASGPVKKLNIRGHQFNFPQRANIVRQQGTCTISGKFQHYWRFFDDDNVYFTIVKQGNKVVKTDMHIGRSRLAGVANKVVDLVGSAVKSEVGGLTGGLAGGVVGELSGLEGKLNDIERRTAHGWEDVASLILAHIALRADPTTGRDRLISLRMAARPSARVGSLPGGSASVRVQQR